MSEADSGVVEPPQPAKDGPPKLGRFRDALAKFCQREDGPTAVEYAVMLALIIVVCLAAITTLGDKNLQPKPPPSPEAEPEPAPPVG